MTQDIKILVIDDEEVILLGVQKILKNDKEYSYKIDTALSGEEGLKLAQSADYDIIFIDLVMPGMDGMKLLTRLVKLDTTAQIIMFTGYATMQTALKALRTGARDFIAKPFTKEELRGSVHKAMLEKQKGTVPVEIDTDVNAPVHSIEPQPGQFHNSRGHILARMDDDREVTIGIEKKFLMGIGKIKSVGLVDVGKQIVQGEEFCKIIDSSNNAHILIAPLSGKVIQHNHLALKDYSILYTAPLDEGWLLRIELTERTL